MLDIIPRSAGCRQTYIFPVASLSVVPQKLEFVDCNLPRDFRNTSPRFFLLFRSFVLNFFLFRFPPPPFPSGPMATQRKKRTDCNNYRKGCIHSLHEKKKVTVDSRKHFRVAMTPSSAEQILYIQRTRTDDRNFYKFKRLRIGYT